MHSWEHTVACSYLRIIILYYYQCQIEIIFETTLTYTYWKYESWLSLDLVITSDGKFLMDQRVGIILVLCSFIRLNNVERASNTRGVRVEDIYSRAEDLILKYD